MSHYGESHCYRYLVFSQKWTEAKTVHDHRPKLSPREFTCLLDKRFRHTEDKLKWHLFDLPQSQNVIKGNPRKNLVPWPLNKDITPETVVIVKAMPPWVTKRRVIATEREWNERYDTFVFDTEPTTGIVKEFDEAMTEDERITKMTEDTSIPTVRVGVSSISYNDSLNLPENKNYICDKCRQRGHLIGECPMFPDLEKGSALEIEADETYLHVGYIRKKASGEPLKGVPKDQYIVNKTTQGFGYIASSYTPTTHFDCEMCAVFGNLPCRRDVNYTVHDRIQYNRDRQIEARLKSTFDFVLDCRCATFRHCSDNLVAYLKVGDRKFAAFCKKVGIDHKLDWGLDSSKLALLTKLNDAMEKDVAINKESMLTNARNAIETQQKQDRGEVADATKDMLVNETISIKLYNVAIETVPSVTPARRNHRQSTYIDDKVWPIAIAPFVSGCCKTRMCRRCWIVSGLYRNVSVCYNCGTKNHQ